MSIPEAEEICMLKIQQTEKRWKLFRSYVSFQSHHKPFRQIILTPGAGTVCQEGLKQGFLIRNGKQPAGSGKTGG